LIELQVLKKSIIMKIYNDGISNIISLLLAKATIL